MAGKPSLPVTIPALGFVAVVGLVAQFLAARAAFDLVSSDPFHPFFAALLIEAAVVADALTTARTRNEVALGSLVLALVVSGIYNYAAANEAGPGLHLAVKLALAVGPVLALASIGLALGEEVWRYEERVSEWKAGQAEVQAAADEELRRFELKQEMLDRESRRKQEALDREFQRKELRRERLARQKLEREQASGQVASGEWASGRSVGAQGDDGRSVGGQWVDRWATVGDFLSEVGANPGLLDGVSGAELGRRTGKPVSTSGRWMRAARELIGENGRKADGM